MRPHAYSLALLVFCPVLARGDGGTIRLAQVSAGYRITLFTAPPDLRVGMVDFSVLVQPAGADTPLLDVPVTIRVHPVADPDAASEGTATTTAATNKLYQALQLDLSQPGRWRVEVVVGDSAHVETEIEVGPPLPSWLDLGLWIGWPAAAILLFAMHRRLVRRSKMGLHL